MCLQELLQLKFVRTALKAYAKHVARKVAKRQDSFEAVLLQYNLTEDEEVCTYLYINSSHMHHTC